MAKKAAKKAAKKTANEAARTRAAEPREADGKRIVYAVSDSTATTAETLARAAGEQFDQHEFAVKVHPNVVTRSEIERILGDAVTENALVVYTFAGVHLVRAMRDAAAKAGVHTVHDPFTPLVDAMGRWLGEDPVHRSGHLPRPARSLAFEFAVASDDGRRPGALATAQVVILGVSRTSKTSVSYQLAERGYLAANCPIVLGVPLPPQTASLDPRRVFVLMMDPEELSDVRRARIPYLGRGQESYADVEQVEAELRVALGHLRAHSGWTRIDVTKQPPEETAAKILEIFLGRFPDEVR